MTSRALRRSLVLLLMAVAALACSVPAAPGSYDHSRERGVILGKTDTPAPKKPWTFLYYGAGDNDLAENVLRDVNELESVGSSATVHVVAFYDLTGQGARRAYLEADGDDQAVHSAALDLGARDSGNADTLIEFATWALTEFPAERYALVVSGHGGGSPREIAPDEPADSSMTLIQLERAVEFIHTTTGRKLELFGGDACLMQTVETGYEIADAARAVVASENEEPGDGWSYDELIAALAADPNMDGLALGRVIVDAFAPTHPDETDLTLSVVDTTRLGDFAAALSLYAEAVRNYLGADPARRAALAEVLAATYRPSNVGWDPDDEEEADAGAPPAPDAGSEPAAEEQDPDGYVDVGDLAARTAAGLHDTDVAWASEQLAQALRAALVASYVSPALGAQAHGASVFWPVAFDEDEFTAYRAGRFARDTIWDEFVESTLR